MNQRESNLDPGKKDNLISQQLNSESPSKVDTISKIQFEGQKVLKHLYVKTGTGIPSYLRID